MMDVNNDGVTIPEEEVNLEIDDLEDGVLDPANDDAVEDIVLYRGAWYVSPLNARQEATALVSLLGLSAVLMTGAKGL